MGDQGYGDFEFERRFYVQSLPAVVLEDPTPNLIVQNYYLANQGHAIRVRAQGPGVRLEMTGSENIAEILEEHANAFDFCAITVKGPMNGGTRYEAEREIDLNVGLNMLRLGGDPIIKNRYALWLGADGWVIDVFGGQNKPLIVAECERSGPVTDLSVPSFCTSEVTEDKRFSNESLSHSPFATWARDYQATLASTGPTFMQSLGTNTIEKPAANEFNL